MRYPSPSYKALAVGWLQVLFLFVGAKAGFSQSLLPGHTLPAWQSGWLDIHHINTGRGNAAFCILPDGTTLQIDAGELAITDARTLTARNARIRPDSSRRPYEWLAHYIGQVMPAGKYLIDYALITHFHDDHFGNWYPWAPLSPDSAYVLTGITGLGSLIPIAHLLDRAAPHYNYPYALHTNAGRLSGEIDFSATMNNYFAFVVRQQQKGMQLSGLQAGSRRQIVLKHQPDLYPNCFVRNVKSGPNIWTGKGDSSYLHFTDADTSGRRSWPDENALSCAISIHYGPFVYYSGGDNPGQLFDGDRQQRDVETPIARALGAVSVASMDHHGNRDGLNKFFIQTLRPKVWVGQTWSADHPGHEVLIRLTSRHVSPYPSDLFATNMLEANRLVIGPLIDSAYKSQQGHVVVRVAPGGQTFYVIVLDDDTEKPVIKLVAGPYQSQPY